MPPRHQLLVLSDPSLRRPEQLRADARVEHQRDLQRRRGKRCVELQLDRGQAAGVEQLLAEDVLDAVDAVGQHRRQEADHVEGQLRGGAEDQPEHHRDERQVDLHARGLAQDDPRKNDGEEGRRRLDGLGERRRDVGERDQPWQAATSGASAAAAAVRAGAGAPSRIVDERITATSSMLRRKAE